jgi:hypothetical protein
MTSELQAPKAGNEHAPSVSELFRQATDVAHVCREVVLKTVVDIAGRRYVRVEGWMAISVAHGCIASIRLVETVQGEGVRAIAQVRRISDQAVLAEAEGFVGRDEPDWFGGEVTRWNKREGKEMTTTVAARPMHAVRAMAQTRAISRVLRAGFSHVVVLIDSGLSTVPAEEVVSTEDDIPIDDPKARITKEEAAASKKEAAEERKPAEKSTAASDEKRSVEVPRDEEIALREQFREHKWEAVVVHFGKESKGKKLGELSEKSLRWWINDWHPRPFGTKGISPDDLLLRAALDVAGEELAAAK